MAVALLQARQSEVSHFYYDYLSDAVGIFEGAIMRLKNCENSQCQLADAVDMAHRIKGNAAMYGYSRLGLMAAETENLLRKLSTDIDPANSLLSLVHLVEKIQDICQPNCELGPTPLQHTPMVQRIDTPSPSQSVDVSPKRKRILIAYKDLWISELMASLLEPEFSVTISQSGEKVLSEIRRRKTDLLILEDHFGAMDDLNFFETIKGLKEAEDVSIFMTFSPNSSESIARALSLGVDNFVEDKHEILDIVATAQSHFRKPPQRALVVDDDPVVRDLLSHVLASAGLEVDVASDGLEALAYLSQVTPDIVLLDRFMPRLEGGTVLYEIKNKINLKSIPVLILTAMVNQGEATSWFERGAADFIPKPFDPEEVLMRVQQHLQRAQKVG